MTPVEKTRLIAQSDHSKNQQNCDYYGKLRHTKETCWKLHGRPTNSRRGRKDRPMRAQTNLVKASETADTPTVGTFSTEDIQSLKHILFQLNSSTTIGASNMDLRTGKMIDTGKL